MKRESSYKANTKNLVFHAPLDKGNLKDMISGVEPVTSFGGSITWDDNEDMYLFDTTNLSNSYYNPITWKDLNLGMFTDDTTTEELDFAIAFKIKIVSCKDAGRPFPALTNVKGSGNDYKYVCMIAKNDLVPFPTLNALHDILINVNDGNTQVFIDREPATTMAARIDGGLPTSTANNFVSVGSVYWGNTIRSSEYLKDVRIYNKSFTEKEIKQL